MARLPLLLALSALALPAAGSSPASAQVETRVRIRETIVVRVPARLAPPVVPQMRWKAKRGPKCVSMGAVFGAAVVARRSVDFILRGGARVRAELETSCPALDYYSGFYLRPASDGMICADRDAIHTRSGGECGIDRFRALSPVPRR